MAATLTEKILARASGKTQVTPGEIVTARVDLAMMHDSGGPRRVKPMLERLGAKVWDPDRIVVVSDHYVPAIDAESAQILDLTRKWVKSAGISKFFDMRGICHVVLPENGLIRPGMLAVGGDSHSPTGGAFGAFMVGIGATEMLGVLVTGEIWLKVPSTRRFHWDGLMQPGVSAKDMILRLCADIDPDDMNYRVAELAGPAITALGMPERMTLCNMTAELGAKTGLIAPDATTAAWLTRTGVADADALVAAWQEDEGAPVEAVHRYDASSLGPQVAAPHNPANSGDIGQHVGQRVDQAYIGACTGAKLDDLHMAASVLKGRKVADGTRLLIAPATTRTTEEAIKDGTLATLTEAGAILLPSGCGACAGLGAGLLADGEVCIASTARNFKGRMGSGSASVWLASPYSVAAAAVAGRIADPREMLS